MFGDQLAQLLNNQQFLSSLALLQSGMTPTSQPQDINWAQVLQAFGGGQNKGAQTMPDLPSSQGAAPFGVQNPSNAPTLSKMSSPNYFKPDPIQASSNQGNLNSLMLAAQQAYPDSPIMQQVALSQAILESGAPGKMSGLATKNFNLFGIKGKGTAGSKSLPTQEYMNGQMTPMNQGFAVNNSIADSFAQHSDVLTRLKRDAPVLNAQTPQAAFGALQKAGYATDPNYASKLNKIFSLYVAPMYQ